MISLDKTFLKVKVIPNSSKRKILSFENDIAIITLKESAEKNNANDELCSFLSKYFGKPVQIIRGKKSPKKELKIG